MIAKLERTLSKAQQNKDQIQSPHKHWEKQKITSQQHLNHRLRTPGLERTAANDIIINEVHVSGRIKP